MPRILSVSQNTRLLVTRNDVLAMAGYSVSSPRTPQEAPLLLQQGDFEAAVIGHSVEAEERKGLIPALRNAKPGIPIIFVYEAPLSGDEPLADASVNVTDPIELVKRLSELRRARGAT